jgi:AcrR family transcriptional regulator
MAKATERGWALPRDLQRLWADQEGAARKNRAGLNVSEIVATAVAIADQRGLAEVTMARLARELGFATMALYRHVPNKAALLVLMVDAGIGEPPPGINDAQGWRAKLEMLAWAISASYRAHPWLLDIPISGPPATPNNMRWLEAGLGALRATTLEMGERISVWLLVAVFIRGQEQLVLGLTRGSGAAPDDSVEYGTYGDILRLVLNPEQFPETTAAMNQGLFDDGDESDDDIAFGLQRVLDGIAVFIDAREH